MKATFKLLILLAYTIAIFFISNYWVLGIIATCNTVLMILFKVPKLKALKNLYFLSFFILFTAVINYFFADLKTAILIVIRLALVCNFTYTYQYILTAMELATAIEIICFPLKILGINPKDISLIVNIALTFVPILSNEFIQIKYALKAKGINNKNNGFVKKLQYTLKPMMYSIFRRTSELEFALKNKGYTE